MGSLALIKKYAKSLRCRQIDPRPCAVPDGEYDVVFVSWALQYPYGRPTLILLWRIVSPGKYFEVELPQYYRLESISKDQRRFHVGWRSAFAADYSHFFRLPRKKTHFDPNSFAGHVFKCRTLIPKPQKSDEHRRHIEKARVDELVEMKA